VVVSRGDEGLLRLGARPAWHFPRLPDGRYAGYHPADSAEAISQLEELRAEGAGYLVLPSTAFWWLNFYEDLASHLEERYEMVVSNDDCIIYRMLEEGSYAADKALITGASGIPGATRDHGRILNNFLHLILPEGARVAVLNPGTGPVPPGAEPWQPPQAAVADPREADRQLDALATKGVEFLVIPSAAFDWLRAHPALGETLGRGHRLVTRQQHVCEIYELSAAHEQPSSPAQSAASEPAQRKRPLLEQLGLRRAGSDGR
jgi:hypothetical protein